jgi:hypothetical protein
MNSMSIYLQCQRGLRGLAFAVALAALASPATSMAEEAVKRYALEHSGFLQLKVPAGWREEIDAKSRPPIISFRPAEGKSFMVSVIPAQAAKGERVPSRKRLRDDVEQMAEAIRHFAVEGDKVKLQEFSGASGPGFQFFATDAAPAAGEFKYMTRGKMNVKDVSVTFTILTNEGQEAVVRSALGMLKSASRVAR